MITLSKSGSTVTFTFDENSGYLQNGTIDVPINSLALITDESDMATFRKAASNDIFISARYEEFGMSKAELEAWYKANMVSSGGGGGGGVTPEEVQTMIDESISGKADSISAVSSAEYVSSSTTINFKNIDGTVISSIDASDFVIDGMIDNVSIETISGASYLVIDFNTASGKEDIQIPLTDIFDPSNYYTKTEVDGALSGKVDTTVYTAYTAATDSVLSGKQKTIEAGRGISLTTGATADTVSLGFPISASTGVDSLLMSGSGNTASGDFSVAYGKLNTVSGECGVVMGNRNTSNNFAEFAIGQKNVSRTEDASAFGHSGNTLFSVGNGIINEEQGIDANHNAFEIRGNGDIYIADTNSSGGYYQKPMIKLQDAIGGGESCTVDTSVIFDSYEGTYNNDVLDIRVSYVILNYIGDKTQASNIPVEVNFRDENYNSYVNQYVYFDYTTSSYTLGDQSQAEYIDINYDPTIEDFIIAVASAYTATIFVGRISNFWGNYIKVPFYTISSGSPCTVIENDITSAMSRDRANMLKALRFSNLGIEKDKLLFYSETLGGNANQFNIKLDEIDGSGNTLKPDIYVGLGTSGWTEINVTEQCGARNLNGIKFRVTYDYSEFDPYYLNLTLNVTYGGNQNFNYVTFDIQTQEPSLQTDSIFSAATVEWSAATKELVITYPLTVDLYDNEVLVNIAEINSNGCQFGQTITKLEVYGEDKQALKPYVQQNRAALGGLKLQQVTQAEYDALVSGGTVDSSTLYIITDNVN